MCSRKTCSSCSNADECGWCTASNAVAVGDCIALSEPVGDCILVTEKDQCPSLGGDVILKNITGMLGVMIGVAIILNVYNRVSNRRRRRKLQHSIFELPVYVYTASTRKRAKAATLARLQAQGEEAAPSDPTRNVEATGSYPAAPVSSSSSGSSSSSSSEDGDEASVVTCTVCLAAYEEDDVIKVLPCGHDFHSGCLDCWLEQKATCPLCLAPAFTKLRDQDWTSHSQASIQGLRQQADAAPPLFAPSDQQAQSSQEVDARSGDGVDEGLLLGRPASPPPPETNGEAGVDGSPLLSEARRSGEGALETARREEEEEGATAVSAMAMAMAMAMAVEEGGAGARKDGAVSEEMATTAVVDADIQVGAGEGASGAGAGVAGDGGDEGPAAATHPLGLSSPPYHGGDTTTDAATSRVTPRRADREVSLTELEKGQAGPAKAAVVVADVAVDAVDSDGVVAGGGIAVGAVGHGEIIGAAGGGGGVDVEGGRSGVVGNEAESAAVAFQV